MKIWFVLAPVSMPQCPGLLYLQESPNEIVDLVHGKNKFFNIIYRDSTFLEMILCPNPFTPTV